MVKKGLKKGLIKEVHYLANLYPYWRICTTQGQVGYRSDFTNRRSYELSHIKNDFRTNCLMVKIDRGLRRKHTSFEVIF